MEWLEDRTVPAGLTLSLADPIIPEGLGTTGTVTRTSADLSQPLTVWLSSSDTTEATVPGSVVIPAGQASATFPVAAQDDTESDGTQPVTFTAQANPPPTFDRVSGSTQSSMTQTLASLPDGRYVTAGLKYVGPGPHSFDIAVSRFLPDSQPDMGFGSGGTVVTSAAVGHYDTPTVVLPQSDGKILVAGHTAPEGGSWESDMFVLRFNTNGTLDTTFGAGGKVVLDFGPNSHAEVHDLTFGPSGSIYLAGKLDRGDLNYGDFAVARLTASGAYDPTWGGTGLVTTNFLYTDTIYEAVPGAGGKLVVVGQAGGNSSSATLAMARYNTNGTLDTTFGTGGKVSLDLPGIYESLTDFIFRPNGNILAVGKVQPFGATSANPHDWVLTQFTPAGALDPSFGNGGVITYDFGGDDQAQSVVQMAGDTFAVSGFGAGSISGSDRKPVLVQFAPNGNGFLASHVVPRNGALGHDLIYQNNKLRLAGTSNLLTGGFVDDFVTGGGGTIFAYAALDVEDTDPAGPSVQPDAYDAGEDETLTVYGFGVLANDFSPNGDLTASLVSGPAHGTLTLNPDGSFTYTPEPNYYGPDGFTYRATDTAGLSGVATVSLTVWGMDDRIQLAVPGPQTTAEDTPLTFSAANGNAFTITDIENPRVLVALLVYDGILTLPSTAGLEFPYPDSVNNSPHITFYADSPAEANAALEGLVFTPTADRNGMFNLDILVRDVSYIYAGPPIEVYASVSINVTPVNDAPTAAPDTYDAYEDETLAVYGFGVLGNDTDVDNDPLSAVLVSGPAHGTVTLNPGGGFTYTPAPNYNGPDSFTYRATDPAGLSSEATVSLNVWWMDDPIAVAVPGPRTVPEDGSLTFSAANGNAIVVTDIDSPRIYVELGVYGILTLQSTAGLEFPYPEYTNNAPNIIFYADSPAEANAALEGLVFTPYPNETSSVNFSVYVRDESFVSYPVYDFDSVPLTITPVNDAPTAVADGPYSVEAGETLIVNTAGWLGNGVLTNDWDVDADPLSAVLVSGPAHGTLTLNPDGTFTYTADVTYTGTDTFTYRASDGQLQSDSATVTIQVNPRNLPPVGAGDAYSVDEDGSLSVGAPGVLGNDSDPEEQSLTAQLVSGPAHGSLTLNPDGSFTYTPAANYHGPDGFWYRASDGARVGESTHVALTVNPVNDAPTAAGDAYAVDEDASLTVPAAGLLANDSDLEGDALSAALVGGPSHGTVTLNSDGSFTYTPATNYHGPDSFTYRAADPGGAGSVATVSLTVRPMADAPAAVDDAYTATEDAPFSVVVAGVSSLTMVSDPGDYIGQGQTWNYGSGATYEIYYQYPSNPTSNNAITVNVETDDDWWYLSFHAPNNERFVPGTTYLNATRFPFNDDDKPGMDISGNGRGSNTLTGWFRVDEVAYGPNGEILVFAVTFEQHSEGRVPALRGTVRYNAGATVAGGVLLNDADPDGNPLTAVLVEGPANGQVWLNPNGTFMYLPNANFFGVDTFRYKVSDGTSESNVATVTIAVAGVNDAPVNVVPGTQTLLEDTTVTFSAANGNAIRLTDVDAGDSVVELRLSVNGFMTFPTTTGLTFVTGINGGNIITVRGTVADLNAALDGMVFRPGSNFTGNYSLQVTTNDLGNAGSGGARSDSDYVTLSITRVNDAPQNVVPLITPVTAEDTPLTFSPAVWITDVDQHGTAYYYAVRVTVEIAAGAGTLAVTPAHGIAVVGNGTNRLEFAGAISYLNNILRTLVFTPAADANDLTAPVQLRVTTNDLANGGPGELTDTDTFAVSVTPVNDAPQFTLAVGGVSVPMNYGNAVALLASGTVGPATATDELALQTLAYGVEVTGTTGNLAFAVAPVIAADGRLSFTPAAGTWGTATLRVWASDGYALTPDQSLDIWVTNAAPTTGGVPPATTAEDTPTSVTLSNHFADAEDDSSALTYTVVGNTNPALFGSVSATGGVLTLTPTANASGTATLTVRATDSGGLSVETDLSVTVNAVNDAPTSTGLPPVTADEDAAPTSVTLTGHFADVEDGSAGLTYAVVGNTNPGLLSTFVADGVLTLWYTPNAHGSATLTVRATDAGGLSVDVPLTVTVGPVNDAPTGGGLPSVAAREDAAPATLTLTDHFADLEDGPAGLTYAVVGNTNPGLFGSVSTAGGVLALSFAPDAHGSATLTVRATDAGGLSVDVPLAVAVSPVNDAPSFAGGPNVTVASDSGPRTVAGWAAAVSRGPADEAGQALTFAVSADSPLLFAVQPAIDPATGALTFTPVAGASGTATVTVVLRDDGGTADGGADASAPTTFTITLTPPALPPGMQVIGTELVITGAGGNDSITVATISGGNGGFNGVKITGTINGQSVNRTFRQTLTRLRVSAGGGSDTITVPSGITLPTVLDGGAGDDTIRGGAGPDLIFGGDGKDNIQGNNGDDDVDAGSGDDTVTGGLGRDLVLGGAGNDTLRGGDGNDLLVGGLGADQLYGENGHDILVGGSAVVRNPATDSLRKVLNDWDPALLGVYVGLRDRLTVTDDPASSDRLQGDAGTDWFWSWDLTDVLDLGAGEQRN